MAANKRSRQQRDEDLTKIAGLYLNGTSQLAMARSLGLHPSQITYDIKQLNERWRALLNVEECQGRELARLDRLEAEYWAAWEKSKERAARSVTRRLVGEDTSGQVRIEEDAGDPRYLAGVMSCIQERLKIVGGYAPLKNEIGGPGGVFLNPPSLEVHFVKGNGDGKPDMPAVGVELKPH